MLARTVELTVLLNDDSLTNILAGADARDAEDIAIRTSLAISLRVLFLDDRTVAALIGRDDSRVGAVRCEQQRAAADHPAAGEQRREPASRRRFAPFRRRCGGAAKAFFGALIVGQKVVTPIV